MTDDEVVLFDEFKLLNERAAVAEREAQILQTQYQNKLTDASNLRTRAREIAKQLGLT